MSLEQSVVRNSSPRVEALRARHKVLAERIESEQSRPFTSAQILVELKREKLKLKEKIEGIRN